MMNGLNSSNISLNGLKDANYDELTISGISNKVLYCDSSNTVYGIDSTTTGYLYNSASTYSYKVITLSDINFNLTTGKVIISDGGGNLTTSGVSTNQLNQISTNTYAYSDSTTNLNLIYNYYATYKNNFIVQQYNAGYTNALKINSDNCYIDSSYLLLNYNLAIDSNIVCKNGKSIIFNTYNGTTYTQLLKLNTSNITCSYPLISSTIYTDIINYNSFSSDLSIIFNTGYNFNIKNGSNNYLQVNTTNTTGISYDLVSNTSKQLVEDSKVSKA